MTLNVELLEQSFQLVAPQGDALVARFYERLFQKYPDVRPLFQHVKMKQQKKKLLGSITLIIQNLRKPELLQHALMEMGGRHVGYGVQPGHYAAVKENLLAVLAEFAGEAWTPQVNQAWSEALSLVNTIMLEGAKQASTSSRVVSPIPGRHLKYANQNNTGSMTHNKSNRLAKGEQVMKSNFQFFSNWGIAAKLVTLFVVFGLIPMTAVGWIAFSAADDMKAKIGARFTGEAKNLADKIDRNLFQRYGDVQAFGFNDAITRTSQWYDPSEFNVVSQIMNKYVKAYGIYDLALLVDPTGDVIAVNFQNAQGEPIDVAWLFKKNFKEASWFQALEAGEFTTKMPFTAPGNNISSGTFIEDVHIDEDVKQALGNDGLVMGFSAPVYDENGRAVAYWSNRTNFGAVEQMFQDAYANLKELGFSGAELTLLDSEGRVLVDYDPKTAGTMDILRNYDVLMKLNLAEKGVVVAQKAVKGEAGFLTALHARKQINQIGGYAHLQGALGFPGMNWSILVRVPESEAAAQANAVQSKVIMTGLICLASLLPIGWFVGRQGARQVRTLQEAADQMAKGNYAARVDIQSKDEIGQLGNAFNAMASEIQTNVAQQEQANQEMSRIKTALDNASTNVMVCDRNYQIIYNNKNSEQTLRAIEKDLQQILPSFAVDKVVGSSIDQYHKNPAHQRQLLDNPKNLPYRSEIQVGPLTLDLAAAAIMSDTGEYLGNVVEWSDVTAQKKAEREVDQLIGAAAKGELSNRINTDEFSGFFKTLSLGVNQLMDAIAQPLAEAQQVLTALAEGDLSKKVTGNYEGEFDRIKGSLNAAIENLTGIVEAVRGGADQVSTASEEITRGNEDLSQRTSAQAGSLEETSASMEEMTSTIKQNADNAKQANQLAVTAREVAEKGGTVTEKAVDAMAEINKSSKKIADIINVIDEIAFQTNLLALNAAVEAARAGEQGRGFAVVASEVRNLAQRSATAAKEIKALINESVQKVGDGSDLVNQSGQTLEEIVNSVKRVTDIIAEISAASQEQASGIDQVNKAVMQMDQSTQQNAALVEEATSASQSMKQQAAELTKQVGFFKIDDGAGRPSGQAARPSKKPASASKPLTGAPVSPPPATVGSSNGHKSSKSEDDFFEEF